MPITTVPENDFRERFVATAGQTVFPFDFPIFDAADLQVIRERSGVPSTLVQGTDYLVTGAGEQSGGFITLTAGALLNDIIVLLSAMPLARTSQYVNGGDLPAAALENDFNRIRILLRQILRDVAPGLLYPQTDPAMPPLPPVAARAGRFLGFDANGQPYAAAAPPSNLDAIQRAGDTMTGPLRVPAGSAAVPGLTPAGDANTGFFSPASDEMALSLGGQQVAIWNANGLSLRDQILAKPWPIATMASAATMNISAQNTDAIQVTGTTGITSFGTGISNTRKTLIFDNTLMITHNGATLICPGSQNLTMAAGDALEVICLGTTQWRIFAVSRAAGTEALAGLIANSRLTMSGPGVAGRLSAGAGALQEIKLGNTAAALSLGINRPPTNPVRAVAGSFVDWTNTALPVGIRRVKLFFEGIRKNGTSLPLIQLGSAVLLTTGYRGGAGGVTTAATAAASTQGFLLTPTIAAADVLDGVGELLNIENDRWLWNFSGFLTTVNRAVTASGRLDLGLSQPLNFISLRTANGTDLWQEGNMGLTFEY